MKTLNQHFKLFAKNWKLGLMVFSITALFMGPAIYISDHFSVNAWWFILTCLPIVSMTIAFFVAETQKEMMSRGAGFLLPNLGSTVRSSQVLIMTTLGLASFLLAYFLPALESVTTGNLLHSLSISVLVMATFSLTLLVDFLFKYSAWLTSGIMFPFFFYIKMGKIANVEFYRHWLGNSGILLMVSALVMVLVFRILTTLNLPRRLAENPYISTLQMYKPTVVQEFKNRSAAHSQPKDQSQRPLKSAMDFCLEKSSGARFAGKDSWAIFWDALHLALATGIPRGFMGAWNYVPFIVPFILFIGYADSMPTSDEQMVGWFSSFPFMFATLPTVAGHFLRTNPLGFPRSREATEKAGYIFAGWAVLVVIVLSVLIFGTLHFLAAVMPEFETGTRLWSYHPSARIHTPFLPLLIMPVVLIIYLLWHRSSAQMVLGMAGMQVFLLFNFLLSGGENEWPAMVALGLSLAAWISLPGIWRRRIRLGT